MKVTVCACCGHPLPETGVLAVLTPMQQRLFRVIHGAGRAGITREAAFERMYAERSDGGPEYINILNVVRHQMAPRLAPFGLRITSTRGRYAVWTVNPAD